MPPTRLMFVLAALSCLSLAACGGGGNASPGSPGGATVTLEADALMSGTAGQENGTRVALPGGLIAGGNARAFPFPVATEWRMLLSFDLSGIPAGATILSAELTVEQVYTEGDPYASGPLLLDHVDLAGSLDAADFDSASLTPGVGVLSLDLNLAPKTTSVTAAIQADVAAGRTTSSLRGYFTEADSFANAVALFQDTDDVNATGQPPPILKIRYQ